MKYFLLLFLFPTFSYAQTVFFEERNGVVDVLVSYGSQINAVDGILTSSHTPLDVRDSGSVVTFWVERPNINENKISFSGIIPGGISPDKALLFSTVVGEKDVVLSVEGNMYLHDGKGTSISFRETQALSSGSIVEENDTTPPEAFVPQVVSHADLYEGAWTLIFETQDKQSGILEYRVEESPLSFMREEESVKVESPYKLTDQERESFIHVRAIDKAGNDITITLLPLEGEHMQTKTLVFFAILICIFVAFFILRRNRSFDA